MTRTLRTVLNEANPNKLPDALRRVRVGEALAVVPRSYRGAVESHVLVLPESAKARAILACFVSDGDDTGVYEPASHDPTPGSGQCGINAAGNIVFNSGDDVDEAEILYVPVEGTEFEDLVVVSSDAGQLLHGRRGAQLLEVEALEGDSTGDKALELRDATPGAGEAALSADGRSVVFAGADGVTLARVRYIAQPGDGSAAAVGDKLGEAATF